MTVDLTGTDWDVILAALQSAADTLVDIDDPDNYTEEDLDGIDADAASYVELHNRIAAQVGGGELAARLVRRPDTDAFYGGDTQDCVSCGHRLYLHERQASGAYRCKTSGCGCEQSQ